MKQLRTQQGLRQIELAEAAGTTERTVRNIEGGSTAGQAAMLIKIFRALNVELEHRDYAADVQSYLAMVAPLIEQIEPANRLRVMTRVIGLLSDAVAEGAVPTVGGAADTDATPQEITEKAREAWARGEGRRAAKRRTKKDTEEE
ncbi:helix-turn-helix domain-containing protein [Herbiconiux solani]|uniref:helix-turn-helix domain-containing protein n=1 Tax=Herbiconiux solani TaxID=661329 RepID=UPI0008267A0F|nr:helix-turn-helix transcriptional regulator [Herbiconiux solani]